MALIGMIAGLIAVLTHLLSAHPPSEGGDGYLSYVGPRL